MLSGRLLSGRLLPGRLLPIHGFVLAGGKSSRMGVDKATLEFLGKPMVEIAVEKLRGFCAEVSIVGYREDLSGFAEVVGEERVECGPAAGVEAGLKAARQAWGLFVPVDVPLAPGEMLRRWAEMVMEKAASGCGVSFLIANGNRQPTFCMVRSDCGGLVSAAMDAGERRLADILFGIDTDEGGSWMFASDAARFAPKAEPSELEMGYWFSNVNTPGEFEEAEAWARVEAGNVDTLPG